MGQNWPSTGGSELDPTGLRPATVEELAAQERAVATPRRRPGRSRTLIVTVTSCALLVTGAGAFALARPGPQPTMVQPYGEDAPFGVGYVDGFGEHSPRPTRKPPAARTRTPPPSATPSKGLNLSVLLPSATPSPVPVGSQTPAMVTEMSAVYWTVTWNTTFDTYVWVHNGSADPANWEVRVQLPAGATVTTSLAAKRSFVDGAWVFTPIRGPLAGGRVYLFAFSGTRRAGDFSITACQVNGVRCVRFR